VSSRCGSKPGIGRLPSSAPVMGQERMRKSTPSTFAYSLYRATARAAFEAWPVGENVEMQTVERAIPPMKSVRDGWKKRRRSVVRPVLIEHGPRLRSLLSRTRVLNTFLSNEQFALFRIR
jgi:hypothetical protein